MDIHSLTHRSGCDVSYGHIVIAIQANKERLTRLYEEGADLQVAIFCSQRMTLKTDTGVKVGFKEVNPFYQRTQTNASTELLHTRLEQINDQISVISTATFALKEFQRDRLDSEDAETIFGRSAIPEIQETVDNCELQIGTMENAASRACDDYLTTHFDPNDRQETIEAKEKVLAEAGNKRGIMEKLKDLLERKRSGPHAR